MTTSNKDTYLLLMSNEIGRHSEKYWKNIHTILIKQLLLSAKHSNPHPNSLRYNSWDEGKSMTSPPLAIFCFLRWRFSRRFKHDFHVGIRHVEEIIHVEVFHKHNAHHSCQPGETPPPFQGALKQGEQ